MFYIMHSEIQGMCILSVKDSLKNGFFLEKDSRKNEGRCSAGFFSEGHTNRGELRSTEKPLRDLGVD